MSLTFFWLDISHLGDTTAIYDHDTVTINYSDGLPELSILSFRIQTPLMAQSLIDVMATIAKLEKRISNVESIMSDKHYDSLPDNERDELEKLLCTLQTKLSKIMNTVAKSEHMLEV